MTQNPEFLELKDYREYSVEQMRQRCADLYAEMSRRRTVRRFSRKPVDRRVVENCIRTAATAPSGANMQPWYFVAVTDPAVKGEIRKAAEKVEKEFYSKEAAKKWVADLKPLGTDWQKPFLEDAPCLIAIFARRYELLPGGGKQKHYYVHESVGIATGLLVAAVHHAGLVALTYTPVRMGFLNEILSRPGNEKPFMILVVGYPARDAKVPVLRKKPFADIVSFV